MKKLLSMLLVFCMLVSLVAPVVPVHAHAAEADESTSIEEVDETEVVETEVPEVVETEEPEIVETEEPEVVETEETEVAETEEPEVVETEETEVIETEEPEFFGSETAEAAELPLASGECGAELTWEVSADGKTLTIAGSGDMADYATYDGGLAPWSDFDTLETVVFPEGMTSVGKHAFQYNKSLTGKIVLPDSVTTIGEYAFFALSNITSVTLPANLETIDRNAFDRAGLTGTLVLPASVKTVDIRAFAQTKITGLTLNEGLETIDASAFYSCYSLVGNVHIPGSVTTIGSGAFDGMNAMNIESMSYGKCEGAWTSLWGAGFDESNKTIKAMLDNGKMTYGEHADADSDGLCDGCGIALKCAAPTNEIPSGEYSESVYFKPSTTTEGAKIMYRELKSATDSQNKWNLFQGSRDYDEVTVVEAYAYMEDGSLEQSDVVTFTYVINKPDQKCGDNLTWKLSADAKTLIIEGTGDMYNFSDYQTGAAPWVQRFTQYVQRNITTLVLPEGITSIGDNSFGLLYGMEGDLIIPDGVTYIGKNAFDFNGSEFDTEYRLELPDSLVTIGEDAFGSCGFTGELVIPSGVTSIGASAFKGCKGFTGDLVLPEGLTTIGKSAFSQCYGFNGKLVIPGTIESIANWAFDGFSTTSINFTGVEFGACQGAWDKLWTDGKINDDNDGLKAAVEKSITYGDHVDADSDGLCDGCGATVEVPHDCSDPMKDEDGFCDICGKCLHSTRDGEDYCWRSYCTHGDCCIKACGDNLRWHYSEGDHGVVVIEGTGDMWDYKTSGQPASPWVKNANVTGVQFNDGITHIGNNAFTSGSTAGSTKLTGTVEIPASVKSIGSKAFYNQDQITGLTLNEGLEEIGSSAFESTSGTSVLTGELKLPGTVKTIGSRAFYKQAGYTGELVLPAALETIGSSAFEGCTGFTGEVVIPANVTKIDSKAFYKCTAISVNLNLPEGLTTIGDNALASVLQSGKLYLPKTIAKIGYGNFPADGIDSVEYGGCNREMWDDNLTDNGVENKQKFNNYLNEGLVALLDSMTFAHVGGTPEDGTCDICGKVLGHDCADTDGDGFCDECKTCMHVKNADGYCTVDGCAHDETCCPKAPLVINGTLPGEILANAYASYSNVGGEGHWNGKGMGYLTAGDEFVYNVNVTEDITQAFFVNAASNKPESQVTVFVDGEEKFSMNLPKTPGDSWNNYQEVVGPELALTAGVHTILVRVDNNNFNFHSFGTKAVEPVKVNDLPGTVKAIDFASCNWYFEGRYATGPDGVTKDAIGNTEPGDTFTYNINATEDFEMLLNFVAATNAPDGGRVNFDLTVDDNAPITVDLGETGGWETYKTLTGPAVKLTKGQHTITIKINKKFNLHSFSTVEMQTLSAPVASPAGGSYDSVQNVTLTCENADAKIYYSLDGSEPSILYKDPIAISRNTTLKAVAKLNGWYDSDVITETYEISAELKCGDNLYYEIKDDGTLRIYGTGAMWDFADMESAPWYADRLNIKSLVLEEGITHMGNNAFADEGLANVMNAYPIAGTLTLPSTLKTIGDYAFAYLSGTDGKSGLTGALVLPEGLESIGAQAFRNTAGFKGDLIIPASCTVIGEGAFCNYNRAARNPFGGKLVLPEGIEVLPKTVFHSCKFTEANIPISVKEIGVNIFVDSGLEKVTYLDGCECEWRQIKDPDSSYGYGWNSGDLGELMDEGKIQFHEHELDGLGWHTSNTYHWYVCTRTDKSMMVDKAAHTYPADDHDCSTALACEVCGYEKVAAKDHVWGEWVVTSEPTETEPGVETRTCSVCGKTETREIPALGHVHNGVTFEPWNPGEWQKGGSWFMDGDWFFNPRLPGLKNNNLTLTADLNLCLCGKTLWIDSFNGNFNMTVPAGVTLNVYDCAGKGRIMGSLTVDGGTVNLYGGKLAVDSEGGQIIVNSGELNIHDGVVSNNDGMNAPEYIENVITVNGGAVNVIGGKVEAQGAETDFETQEDVGSVGVKLNGGKLNITGGTFATEGDNIVTSVKNAIDVTGYTANLTVALEGEWADGDVIANGVTSADQFTVTGAETALKGTQLVVSVHTHAFGDWTVTTPATCTEKGEETRTCECGETETRETEALGHDYAAVVTEPTCTEKGFTTHTCSRCDDSYVDSYVDALGHDFGDWTESKAATCTEKGEERRDCARCDEFETRETEALGHAYGEAVWTWNDDFTASVTFTCANDETHAETVEAVVESEVTTEPACETEGERTYTATAEFGEETYTDTATEVIPAKGHNFEDGTCTDCGEKDPNALTALYRVYNPFTQEHLMVTSEEEIKVLTEAGWILDGLAWFSPAEGTPVYRLYNQFENKHFYSMNEDEVKDLEAAGWIVDGVLCFSASAENGRPVYRLYNQFENTHLFTIDDGERENLLAAGWNDEGIAWYAANPEA